MAELFEHTSINGMSLPNRFVRSATWEGLADKDGSVKNKLIDLILALAKGEIGLIITSYAFVSREGQSSPGQLAVYDDRFVPGLGDMVRAVHSAGGKIALQLVHGGCHSNPGLSGLEAVGPCCTLVHIVEFADEFFKGFLFHSPRPQISKGVFIHSNHSRPFICWQRLLLVETRSVMRACRIGEEEQMTFGETAPNQRLFPYSTPAERSPHCGLSGVHREAGVLTERNSSFGFPI
jgi:hypothetical protein